MDKTNSYLDSDPDAKKNSELDDYVQLHEKAATEFNTRFWQSGEENKRYRKGKHWSKKEEAELDEQDLIAYSLPIAATKINVNVSQQMANRNEWRALGRGREDELNAEIKTSLFKFVDDDNDFENIESDVYADATGTKYGVVKRYTDYSKKAKGRIILKRIPYNQVMWDLNCKDYNIPKFASWMQEYEFFSRQQLKEMYPEKKDFIEGISDSEFRTARDGETLLTNWYRTDRGLQMCKRVVHYQRRFKTVQVKYMSDGTTEVSDPDASEEMNEAPEMNNAGEETGEEPVRQDNMINEQGVMPGMMPEPEKTVLKTIPRIVEYIEAVVFIKDTRQELDRFKLGYDDMEGNFVESDMHCLHPYFNFFDDGDIMSLMDMLKHPQKFLDRVTMQIDRSMSKMIKSSYTIVKQLLEQETIDDWDNISKELVSGGATLLVKDHKALEAINSGIINPELFTMWKMGYQILEDLSGGKNQQGLKESANESGKAVEKRQEAAFMISFLYIDNLRRWKKTLGEGLLENIDEVYGDDRQSTFRVLGDAMSKDVLEILKGKKVYEDGEMPYGFGYINLERLDKPLGETKVDIIVSRAASTPVQKERKFAQLTNWYQMKAANGEQTPPLSLMFPYTDIDPTVKASIMKWEEEQKAEKAAMMQLEKQKLAFQGNMAIADNTVNAAGKLTPPGNPLQADKPEYLRNKFGQ